MQKYLGMLINISLKHHNGVIFTLPDTIYFSVNCKAGMYVEFYKNSEVFYWK